MPPHRAIWSLRLPLHHLADGLALAALFTLALLLLRPVLETAWGAELLWWMRSLRLDGRFAPPQAGGAWLALAVPLVDLRVPAVGTAGLLLHAGAAAALWLAAGRLPDAFKPAMYLLRLLVLVHAASLLFFALWPGRFPHTVAGHVGGGLRQSWGLMLLTPWLHLGTYYLFPFALWQRAALTTATLVFLALLAPLQYASHAALLSVLGLVAMPALHLLFGVMVPIAGVVALYGWAMSWHDTQHR